METKRSNGGVSLIKEKEGLREERANIAVSIGNPEIIKNNLKSIGLNLNRGNTFFNGENYGEKKVDDSGYFVNTLSNLNEILKSTDFREAMKDVNKNNLCVILPSLSCDLSFRRKKDYYVGKTYFSGLIQIDLDGILGIKDSIINKKRHKEGLSYNRSGKEIKEAIKRFDLINNLLNPNLSFISPSGGGVKMIFDLKENSDLMKYLEDDKDLNSSTYLGPDYEKTFKYLEKALVENMNKKLFSLNFIEEENSIDEASEGIGRLVYLPYLNSLDEIFFKDENTISNEIFEEVFLTLRVEEDTRLESFEDVIENKFSNTNTEDIEWTESLFERILSKIEDDPIYSDRFVEVMSYEKRLPFMSGIERILGPNMTERIIDLYDELSGNITNKRNYEKEAINTNYPILTLLSYFSGKKQREEGLERLTGLWRLLKGDKRKVYFENIKEDLNPKKLEIIKNEGTLIEPTFINTIRELKSTFNIEDGEYLSSKLEEILDSTKSPIIYLKANPGLGKNFSFGNLWKEKFYDKYGKCLIVNPRIVQIEQYDKDGDPLRGEMVFSTIKKDSLETKEDFSRTTKRDTTIFNRTSLDPLTVTTTKQLDNLNNSTFTELDYLIVDEVHMILNNDDNLEERTFIFKTLIEKSIEFNFRLVFMTATPGPEIEYFKNLTIKDLDLTYFDGPKYEGLKISNLESEFERVNKVEIEDAISRNENLLERINLIEENGLVELISITDEIRRKDFSFEIFRTKEKGSLGILKAISIYKNPNNTIIVGNENKVENALLKDMTEDDLGLKADVINADLNNELKRVLMREHKIEKGIVLFSTSFIDAGTNINGLDETVFIIRQGFNPRNKTGRDIVQLINRDREKVGKLKLVVIENI